MERKHLEWRVGLFVLVGLTVLAMLLLQFSKGTSLFRPTYNLYLTAKNVGGLKTRASVLMAGVQVGSVSGIKLNPQGRDVTITLRIYKEFDIYKDARFVIEQSGFLGDQYVAIEPTNNEGPTFKSGDMASAQEPFNLQEVARSASGFIERIDETARKLNDAVTDVRRLVLNEQTLTNLAATVGNMRVASQHALATVDNLNSLVGSSSPSIAMAVSNIDYFSDQLSRFGSSLGGVLATNGTEITTAVKNIEASTVVLKSMLEDLQAGKGLAGNVLRNDALATNFQQIAANLTITTSNLNRFGLWGILWSKSPTRSGTPPQRSLASPPNATD